jgi:hypothetical protein
MSDVIRPIIPGNPINNGRACVLTFESGDGNQHIDPLPNQHVESGVMFSRLNFRFDDTGYYNCCGSGSSVVVSGAAATKDFGYEFTGGFEERTTGQAAVSDSGSNYQYTQDMANSGIWKRFGFSNAAQLANDNPYWTDPTPEPASGIGLFGGSHMPDGVTQLFDFDFSAGTFTPSGQTSGGEIYTAASGSFDFSQLRPGSFVQVRFDYNIRPQVANTTVETALIWQTRDANDNPTYTFALTAQPLYYGIDSVGQTFLNRPILTAYFASQEDVNARALLAIRSNNLVQVQPLTTLCIVNK